MIQAACTDQIAVRMQRLVAQQLRESGVAEDAESWLKEVGEATMRALAARGTATGTGTRQG